MGLKIHVEARISFVEQAHGRITNEAAQALLARTEPTCGTLENSCVRVGCEKARAGSTRICPKMASVAVGLRSKDRVRAPEKTSPSANWTGLATTATQQSLGLLVRFSPETRLFRSLQFAAAVRPH